MKTKKAKLSYMERLEKLYGNSITPEWLLHYGSYFGRRTVATAAKDYFEMTMKLEPKERKRAEQLGLL